MLPAIRAITAVRITLKSAFTINLTIHAVQAHPSRVLHGKALRGGKKKEGVSNWAPKLPDSTTVRGRTIVDPQSLGREGSFALEYETPLDSFRVTTSTLSDSKLYVKTKPLHKCD